MPISKDTLKPIEIPAQAQGVRPEGPKSGDPELLAGWRTWLHLTIQWGNLEKGLLGLNVLLGLVIAYLIIMILLVHEGVDHVL